MSFSITETTMKGRLLCAVCMPGPQIFIDDHHVGVCDELYALEREEKLDRLLKA